MSKPIATHCDAGCKKEFKINKFKTRKVKGGIEKTYFTCPHCKHEYAAYYASDETKKLQKEMRKLQREYAIYNPINDELKYREFVLKESELKAKIKRSMDEARRIVEDEQAST